MKLLKILRVINIMYISSLAANKMANGFFEIGNAYINTKSNEYKHYKKYDLTKYCIMQYITTITLIVMKFIISYKLYIAAVQIYNNT